MKTKTQNNQAERHSRKKDFLAINMSVQDKKELRALAHCYPSIFVM